MNTVRNLFHLGSDLKLIKPIYAKQQIKQAKYSDKTEKKLVTQETENLFKLYKFIVLMLLYSGIYIF